MFEMICRVFKIAGNSRRKIVAGIVCNILKSFFNGFMMFGVFWILLHLDGLSPAIIGQAFGVILGSVLGRFFFQWMYDRTMSGSGYDIFRDYRLEIGERLKQAPMGYFSEQNLGTIQAMGNSAFLSKKINTELDRLEEVTDIPKMDTSSEKLVVSHYDISLEHISFGYGGRQVIHDISLEIPEHTTCAIVGPSGSGKTTLCNLIARFWDVQEGTVRIGGKNVRDYTADSVLEYISMVFQNVYLFHDSVENNIRFGRPEATREQVIAAAKRACCHDFILSLPDGYDTIIGEGGSTLSGGEKQRISIARAILKDAPIIILDEATSSVDPENEQALLSAIQELTKDKTLISIAHRLSTVRNADQIIVIDQGRIVQRGTHHELLQKEGIYQRFLTLRTAATGWQL